MFQISDKRRCVYSGWGLRDGNMVLLFDWSDCFVQNNCDWRHNLCPEAQHFLEKDSPSEYLR